MPIHSSSKILIPTDFTEPCTQAVHFAAQLACDLGYQLVMLHVLKPQTTDRPIHESPAQIQARSKLEILSRQLTDKCEIHVDFLVMTGNIFEVIPQTIKDEQIDMLVLGVHGKKGLQYLTGSHALRLVLSTIVPTLIIRNQSYIAFNNILFPVSTFTEATQKVMLTSFFAGKYNSTIHLILQDTGKPAKPGKVSAYNQQITKAFDKSGIPYLQSKSPKKGISFAKAILDYATNHEIQLIVVMTDTDPYTETFEMATWLEKIIFNKQSIPVLCIPPKGISDIDYSRTHRI